jgi:hypothetical protein
MLPFRFTGKELDEETGLYYYGARYLDPRVSRWLSTDPAMGDYIPEAPADEEARRRNGNLPGQGGIYNWVNLHAYHYAGNNPVKYVDPDGREDVYFLYGYEPKDQHMKNDERSSINEEVALLKESGLSVKVVENATRADMIAAFADAEAMMIVTSGHGYEDIAGIVTAEGSDIRPSDVKNHGSNLRTVIFENCHQGKSNFKSDWQKVLGPNVEIIGWDRATYTWESKSFNNNGIINRLLG